MYQRNGDIQHQSIGLYRANGLKLVVIPLVRLLLFFINIVARKRLRSLYSSMWSATVLLIIAVGPTYFWPKLLCRTISCYISYDMGTVVPTARYRADVSHVDRRFVLIVLKNNKNSVELLGT